MKAQKFDFFLSAPFPPGRTLLFYVSYKLFVLTYFEHIVVLDRPLRSECFVLHKKLFFNCDDSIEITFMLLQTRAERGEINVSKKLTKIKQDKVTTLIPIGIKGSIDFHSYVFKMLIFILLKY